MQATPAENSPGGPRQLLRRLRDVMAGKASAQERLDQVVAIIAADLHADVCSIYVRRGGDLLELFSTVGLNPSAVHRTRLRLGEGLVGNIAAHARPLNLADAQSHPDFAYRPETGEEVFHSLLGVPILRGGRVIGVLVIQHKNQRLYDEEESEALQIIAMVMAELVASGELVNAEERAPSEGNALLPVRLEGVRLNLGVAIGLAVLHQPNIAIRQVVAEDPEVELKRLEHSVSNMHSALDTMLKSTVLSEIGEERDVLETYRMIAGDTGWLDRIEDAIRTGLTAEAAVQQTREATRARMNQVTDPYLRERLDDFEALAVRLLMHLTGHMDGPAPAPLPDSVVLIARSMGPAELLDYDTQKVRALVLEEGSPTSHVCVVARALDIPVLGLVKDALHRVEPFDPVIVDADSGALYVRPGEDIQQTFTENMRVRAERRQAYAALRDKPAETRDGARVSLNINAGLEIDAAHLHETGADGIGLYRTEIPFMVRVEYPGVEAQTELYSRIFERVEGKPVVFRTLDVGGDKLLPYFDDVNDENPAMGWRAIRIALDRPAMLRQQVRALVRAAAGRPLSVMLPMVAEVAEFDKARWIIDMELAREKARGGKLPETLRVGAMVEVPSLLWQLDNLLKRVDFLSVGSNDLIQFLFATDRANPRMAERYDVLSPSVLGLLKHLAEASAAAGVPLSLCGEMAGRPLEAMALIGIGYRALSMSPLAVGPVKSMIRSLAVAPLAGYIDSLLASPEASLRDKLRAFARDHGVTL
ncbi:MAG TPA: phosphoenolpyruvate--protein phosphotransferase [Alphaproteobacteria bacterium]|jgi:phosphotransferase system enzyme I (PtsP)